MKKYSRRGRELGGGFWFARSGFPVCLVFSGVFFFFRFVSGSIRGQLSARSHPPDQTGFVTNDYFLSVFFFLVLSFVLAFLAFFFFSCSSGCHTLDVMHLSYSSFFLDCNHPLFLSSCSFPCNLCQLEKIVPAHHTFSLFFISSSLFGGWCSARW